MRYYISVNRISADSRFVLTLFKLQTHAAPVGTEVHIFSRKGLKYKLFHNLNIAKASDFCMADVVSRSWEPKENLMRIYFNKKNGRFEKLRQDVKE